jgi:4-amino-4-deoxy-L-arabinose transferase-like glycosyltransferase
MIRLINWWRERPDVLVLILGLAAHSLVLFGVLPAIDPSTVSSSYGIGFADDYDKLALNLRNGNGYRFSPETAETLLRDPGYPLSLAAAFSVLGYSLQAARLLNILFALATAWLLAKIVREFTEDRRVAAAAQILFLAHPGVLLAEARGGFESMYALCLALLVWRSIRALVSGKILDYFWVGTALGFAVLVRSSLIALPAIALVALLVRAVMTPTWRVPLARFSMFALGMCILLAPWTARNYAVVHEVVPTATISGIGIHVGEYVCRNRDSNRTLHELDRGARDERMAIAEAAGYRFEGWYFPWFYSARDEVEFSRSLVKTATSYYIQNPGQFVRCTAMNLVKFWVAGTNELTSSLNALLQIPYLILAVCGGVHLARRGDGYVYLYPILAVVAYSMVIHAVSFAQARYSVPLVPLLAILGAYPVTELWTRLAKKKLKLDV